MNRPVDMPEPSDDEAHQPVDGRDTDAVDEGPLPLPAPGWRLILALAVPVLAQQALHLIVTLYDRYLAGNLHTLNLQEQARILGQQLMALGTMSQSLPGAGGVGDVARSEIAWEMARQLARQPVALQAAQTTASYLTWFISSYTVLVSVGSTALVSRFTGARQRQQAIQVTHQSLLLALLLGGIISGLALAGGIVSLVDFLQLKGEAARQAVAYLKPIFGLLVFQIVETAGIACLVGAGDTRTGLWVMIGVAIVNVPISRCLCLGIGPVPNMGFVGIALGTGVSHVLGGLAVLAVLMRGRYGLKLRWTLFRPRFDLWRRLLRISLPAGLDSLSVIVGQFWFLSIINRLGDEASSAHGIAIIWEGLGYLSGTAFGTAAMTLVGQNLGAGRPGEATRGGWMAFALGCGVMTAMGVVFYTLAPWMFRVFCPLESQRPIVLLGVPALRLIAFAMPALASTIIFTAALRGAGDTRVPVLFTWIGFFLVRIPLAYFLTLPEVNLGILGTYPGMNLGLIGAWLAMLIDLMVRGVFFVVRFARGSWHFQRV